MFFHHLPERGLICAHRGARSIAPENTLVAQEKARECGAHCWETDVRMSLDGELIIFHDKGLKRTTNVATHPDFQGRQPWRPDHFPADELRKLDAGSWFLADDPFGTVASGEVLPQEEETIRGQKIPMLREILEYTKTHCFPVNLEIKDLQTPAGDVTIVDRIMDMLRDTETMDLVLISSFRYEYLQRARTLDPKIGIAVLAEKNHPPDLIRYLNRLSATAYHPEAVLCTPELIRDLQQAGFRVNTWTINDVSRAETMFRAGAGVITDWPQRLNLSHPTTGGKSDET